MVTINTACVIIENVTNQISNPKNDMMKKAILLIQFLACVILISITVNLNAQANKSLSNLTSPVAVNQHLLPNADNSKDLGSSTLGWGNIYFSNSLFLKGNLTLHSPGTDNFFAGPNAGNTSVTGQNNTGTGQGALQSISTGNYNTATGYNAMYSNLAGANNTAIGNKALYANTVGGDNTATGSFALQANISGRSNTANGSFALYNNTSHYNTGIGYSALYKNENGSSNTATGFFALYNNISGICNTAAGTNSLNNNIAGNNNTASGYASAHSNISGYSNVAIGVKALYTNSSGHNLVAIGDSALYKYNGSSGFNTALGSKTLYNNTGTNNTATGYRALYTNTSGFYNTANGYNSLYSNVTGVFNTAIGSTSLYSNTGSYNTAIGSSSDVNPGLTNATAIGFGALATASNQIWLGNTSVTSVKAGNNIVIVSDGRFKKNMKENVPGLAFINALKPVTYNYDIHKLNDYMQPVKNKPEEEMLQAVADKTKEESITKKEKIVYTGLVAQDVENIATQLGYDFSGVYKPQNDKDPYGLSYSEFVVPLVKAVQELSHENDELKTENQELKTRLDKIEKALAINNTTIISNTIIATDAKLEQNTPNPFNSTTVIRYRIPASSVNAKLVINNAVGAAIKSFTLTGAGNGTVTIAAGELSAGIYNYTLIIDGKKTDSKKMVLIK